MQGVRFHGLWIILKRLKGVGFGARCVLLKDRDVPISSVMDR
jgi:hypothetical protein